MIPLDVEKKLTEDKRNNKTIMSRNMSKSKLIYE